jgi:capsular polysaccharide biosynthesis protein
VTGPAPVGADTAVDRARGSDTFVSAFRRVRRHWAVVLVFVVIAVAGAVAATAATPTTYVGRTSLIVSSNNRSPDQDAVLVQGYITYFNDTAYQRQLLAAVGVHGGVTLSAQAAASSPILIISATAPDAADAQLDAIEVARAFRDDINRVDTQTKDAEVTALQRQLEAAQAANTADSAATVSNLQDRIAAIRADEVNVLQELQAQGGVAAQGPSLRSNLVYGLGGGLLLGIVAALLMGRWSRRLPGALEVADKVGLRTLVEVPGPRGRATRALRDQRLAQLASMVRAQLGGPGVVAVAQPDDGTAARFLATTLARAWAAQGYPTVLVRLDAAGAGAGNHLGDVRSVPVAVPGLSLLELAPVSDGGAPAVPLSRLGEVLEQLTQAGRHVVVEAPAVVRSATAQAVCHVAVRTVLAVDPRTTLAPLAREAVTVLDGIAARLSGAVVAVVPRGRRAPEDLLLAAGNPAAGGDEAGAADPDGAGDRGPAGAEVAPAAADARPEEPVRPHLVQTAPAGEEEPDEPGAEQETDLQGARRVVPVGEAGSPALP